jgi:hypothetical protein
MKSVKVHRKISLRIKIFQYLLLTSFFSVILIGFFWIGSEVKNFKKEVKLLKITFSENKKLEIKSKILELKDWIYWVEIHPPKSIISIMHGVAADSISSGYYKKLLQDYCLDSISRVRYAEDSA